MERVITPRGSYASITALAQRVGCNPRVLYPYMEYRGRRWYLKPLNEATYRRWHKRIYAKAKGKKRVRNV